jgi:hypothetical protein
MIKIVEDENILRKQNMARPGVAIANQPHSSISIY